MYLMTDDRTTIAYLYTIDVDGALSFVRWDGNTKCISLPDAIAAVIDKSLLPYLGEK